MHLICFGTLQTMDLNHDGEITVDEFVHYCRSNQGIEESMTVRSEDEFNMHATKPPFTLEQELPTFSRLPRLVEHITPC